MPKFKYFVRDAHGKPSSGVIEAKDHAELRRMLRANELFLTRYKAAGAAEGDPDVASAPLFGGRVKPRDVVILLRQMATFVRAGIPFADGMVTLAQQMDKPALKVALKDVSQGVIDGQTLSSNLRKYPKFFNELTISMVEAGEVTGTLDQSLEVSAMQLDREEDLRARVKTALVYPKIVVLAAVGTVAAMLLLVVPAFVGVYKEFHGELPGTTQALIAISDFCVHYWWAIALVGGLAYYSFVSYKKTPGGAHTIDGLVLKIPVVGPVLRKVAIARFCQTLAAAVKGGIPIIRALTISSQTAGNVIIRDAAFATVNKVREGEEVAPELEKSGEFPPMVTRMISAGETSGNLDQMLEEINRYYEEDIKYSIDKMTRMIEPFMTVVVGGIVLFVLLALYMPVFNLGKAVLGNK